MILARQLLAPKVDYVRYNFLIEIRSNQYITIKTKVEYALEAINRAGTAVGIRTKNGIILAAEKKILSKVRLNAYLFFVQLFVEVVGKFVHKREATSNR